MRLTNILAQTVSDVFSLVQLHLRLLLRSCCHGHSVVLRIVVRTRHLDCFFLRLPLPTTMFVIVVARAIGNFARRG